MSKQEKIYVTLAMTGLIFLAGIAIGITLVKKKEEKKNWSSKGVVIRFDR